MIRSRLVALVAATVLLLGLGAPAASAAGPAVMPGPSNTGVPSGVALTIHNGDLNLATAGQVISGRDIRGCVNVTAANVTIRNSIIRGRATGPCPNVAVLRAVAPTGVTTIEDVEIAPTYQAYNVDGLRGYNIVARRLDIHHVIDQAHFFGSGNVRLENSWLHDNLHYANDPGWGGGPSHDDNIQVQSGSGFWFYRNRLEGSFNAALQVTQDAGVTANMSIADNYFAGGGCTVNLAQKARPPLQNIDIIRNLFGPGSRFNCDVLHPPEGDINLGSGTTINERTDGTPLRVVVRVQ